MTELNRVKVIKNDEVVESYDNVRSMLPMGNGGVQVFDQLSMVRVVLAPGSFDRVLMLDKDDPNLEHYEQRGAQLDIDRLQEKVFALELRHKQAADLLDEAKVMITPAGLTADERMVERWHVNVGKWMEEGK